jgi:gliding motility-associated-like protein
MIWLKDFVFYHFPFHRWITPGILFIFSSTALIAQSFTGNIGFEWGNFQGWSGATGQCCPLYTPQPGIDSLRHIITSGPGNDPHSGNYISVTAPGSLFSARLGNDDNAAQGESLTFSFTVPADSMILKIQFAVVMEDGLHPADKQARFGYEVISSVPFEGGYDSELIVAGDSNPSKIKNGILEIIPWQTRYISLINQQGNLITINFITGDCGPGGHFGYAYVDAALVLPPSMATGCDSTGAITLHAPAGVNGNWHDGSNGSSVTVSNPLHVPNYFLELNSGSSCSFRIMYPVSHLLPEAGFTWTENCDLPHVQFIQHSTGNLVSSYWDFGDGVFSQVANPDHLYNQQGNYQVHLIVTNDLNCTSEASQLISLTETEEISIFVDTVCQGQPFHLTVTPKTGVSYHWLVNGLSMGTGNYLVSSCNYYGIVPVTLISSWPNGCVDTTESSLVIQPEFECEPMPYIYIPNSFTPNGDGLNDIFGPVLNSLVDELELKIFNRYGQLIFEGVSWDGLYLSQFCPQGSYIYQLRTIYKNREVLKSGYVNLIR